MSEISIQPGGSTPDISANSVYNIPSNLSGGELMRPMDTRSGLGTIKRAVLVQTSSGDISELSVARQANGGSTISNGSFSADGLIGVVNPYAIRTGSAGNIGPNQELKISYQGVGERHRRL